MEGRVVAVEGQLEAVEIAMAETKADTVYLRHKTGALRQNYEAMRQDIQEILKMLGDRNRDPKNPRQESSQSSVNENEGGPDRVKGRRGEGNQEGSANWRKRVELPVFKGGDPLIWISRAEKFFEVQKVAEEEKLQMAFISMEGYAAYWFRFWREKTKNNSWEGLKRALVIRFGEGGQGSVYERLTTIKQVGAMSEYVQDFEVSSNTSWRDFRRRLDDNHVTCARRGEAVYPLEDRRRTDDQDSEFLGEDDMGSSAKHRVSKEGGDPRKWNNKGRRRRAGKKYLKLIVLEIREKERGGKMFLMRRVIQSWPSVPGEGIINWVPSYGNPMRKRSHETKLPDSNLEDKVVLSQGVMLGYKVFGYNGKGD
ncbi:hypothetical protein V8G54_024576 [Vigna mungo]|uniref:Retrotransposon gag domain-containing protein n=1 Tax=Vigna mungo TaxID=3915 RepID=A0AAQ3N6M9_VIGMU